MRYVWSALRWSFWLPVGVALYSVLRLGGFPSSQPILLGLLAGLMGMAWAWVAGMPLTGAIQRLIVYSPSRHPAVGVGLGLMIVLLGIVTVRVVTVAGLFGPIGIFIGAIVFSIPAWLTVGVFWWLGRATSRGT